MRNFSFISTYTTVALLLVMLSACSKEDYPIPSDLTMDGLKGNVKSVTHTTNDGSTMITNYNPDGYYESMKISSPDGTSPLDITYEYSQPGFLSRQIINSFIGNTESTFEYEYDDNGLPKTKRGKCNGVESVTEYIFRDDRSIDHITSVISGKPAEFQGIEFDSIGRVATKITSKLINQDPDRNPTIAEYIEYNDNNDQTSRMRVERNTNIYNNLSNKTDYTITRSDDHGNWIERHVKVEYIFSGNATGPTDYTESRTITYY